ncbi:MAG: M48 family metallopeptidase, partial [Anaerolineales bacterium]|nr:M48 family metallopeptidase [Anaerolineales bacterium]
TVTRCGSASLPAGGMVLMHVVQYGTTTIEYDLSYAERKTMAIEVHPDLQISVIAPAGTSTAEVDKRVVKRAPWILKQLREFEGYLPHRRPRQYVSGETHRYLGRQYRLKVVTEFEGPEQVKLIRGRLLVYTADRMDSGRIKQLVDDWYRRHAKRVFAERLEACFPRVKKLGVDYPELQVRRMKTRWGSCTAEGKILLNLDLIQVPKKYIDYVIVHELCHLKEHHHGTEFYALLDKVLPDWRERRERLNEFEV